VSRASEVWRRAPCARASCCAAAAPVPRLPVACTHPPARPLQATAGRADAACEWGATLPVCDGPRLATTTVRTLSSPRSLVVSCPPPAHCRTPHPFYNVGREPTAADDETWHRRRAAVATAIADGRLPQLPLMDACTLALIDELVLHVPAPPPTPTMPTPSPPPPPPASTFESGSVGAAVTTPPPAAAPLANDIGFSGATTLSAAGTSSGGTGGSSDASCGGIKSAAGPLLLRDALHDGHGHGGGTAAAIERTDAAGPASPSTDVPSVIADLRRRRRGLQHAPSSWQPVGHIGTPAISAPAAHARVFVC
jgi:hypothetical protein